MINKIDNTNYFDSVVVAYKINELIEAFNQLKSDCETEETNDINK